MKRLMGSIAAATLLLAACGSSTEAPKDSIGAGARSPKPDLPVSTAPGAGQGDALGGRPKRVRPRPGMTDIRPVGWEKARQTPDGRHLRVVYWSGVEPCNVLDRVDVRYAEKTITVTLYEGSDPTQPDVACIEIALQKVVKLKLDEPVDGRKIVDGAR